MTSLQSTSQQTTFDLWLEQFTPVAERFQHIICEILRVALEGRNRPTDLDLEFNLGQSMASRLKRAAYADSPREMAVLLPGRPTMLRFIEQAEANYSNVPEAHELRQTYEAFLKQINQMASSRQELTAVFSAHNPELVRETSERKRAAAFRAATDLAGGYAEATSIVWCATPNPQNPAFIDWTFVHTYHGLRRLGVMQPIIINAESTGKDHRDNQPPPCHINGEPMDSAKGDSFVIQEFSSNNLPAVRTVKTGEITHTIYAGNDLPLGEPIELMTAQQHKQGFKNIASHETGSRLVISDPSLPRKMYVSDLLIHKDAWQEIQPQVRIYTGSFNDDEVFPEEYSFLETPHDSEIETLTPHRALLPVPEVPRHEDTIKYVIDQQQLNLSNYRIYRFMMKYPVVSNSIVIYFSRKPEETQG